MHVRELELHNRHGKRMPATVRTPEKETKGTSLVIHGLGGWREQSTVVTIAETLAKNGYQSVTFDGADALRGPDASFKDATTTTYCEDVEDVLSFMKENGYLVQPFILAGHSLGGLVATHVQRKTPEARALLLIAPAVCWYKDRSGRFLSRISFLSRRVQHMRKSGEFMPLYPKWLLDYFKFDIRKDAPYIACPTHIVSAGDDLTVSGVAEHEKLTRLFPNGTHAVVAGATHTFSGQDRELADTIELWLTSL